MYIFESSQGGIIYTRLCDRGQQKKEGSYCHLFYTVNILWLLHVVNHVITWLWHFVSFNPRYIYIFGRRLSCRGVTLRRVSKGHVLAHVERKAASSLCIRYFGYSVVLRFVFSSASKQHRGSSGYFFTGHTIVQSHLRKCCTVPYHVHT